MLRGGVLVGAAKHLSPEDWDQVRVEAMSEEAMTTSEIEGEMLNRASVQSSIQRQLGLATDSHKVLPREQGISELMVSLYSNIEQPLSAEMLFEWHRLVMAGRSDVAALGSFRTSAEPMQVVSGATYAPKVHFEAPPSTQVSGEMSQFLAWFERTSPSGAEPLPAMTRAGVAHLYFESIHPLKTATEGSGGRLPKKLSFKGWASRSLSVWRTGFWLTIVITTTPSRRQTNTMNSHAGLPGSPRSRLRRKRAPLRWSSF